MEYKRIEHLLRPEKYLKILLCRLHYWSCYLSASYQLPNLRDRLLLALQHRADHVQSSHLINPSFPLKDWPWALLIVIPKQTRTANCVLLKPGAGKLSSPGPHKLRNCITMNPFLSWRRCSGSDDRPVRLLKSSIGYQRPFSSSSSTVSALRNVL